MRRKRFKHHLDTIIDILNGYQIVLNYSYFADKDLGEYKLDLLTGILLFNERKIEKYPIFNFIYDWFNKELITHNIPRNLIKQASVIVTVLSKFSYSKNNNKFSHFQWLENLIVRKQEIFRMQILVRIVTDEIEYQKQSHGIIFS